MLSLAAEIIFLRAVTPLYPANQADIIFDITEGNLRDSFDIIKRHEDSMTVGECPSAEPCDLDRDDLSAPLHSHQHPLPKPNSPWPPGSSQHPPTEVWVPSVNVFWGSTLAMPLTLL